MFESDQLQVLRSEPGEHESAHRQGDEGLAASWQALMVAGQSTDTGDPGKGSFDHPPLGQDGKT